MTDLFVRRRSSGATSGFRCGVWDRFTSSCITVGVQISADQVQLSGGDHVSRGVAARRGRVGVAPASAGQLQLRHRYVTTNEVIYSMLEGA